ncbi:MAG: cytochrome c oxidase accessory protein CcoG [Hyphomicrobiaceae bacterium]
MTALKPDDFIHTSPEHASPGSTRYDVKPVNSKAARPNRLSYVGRIAIHPKRAKGTFRSLKWAVMIVTLGIYYLLPWVRWDRGPDLPNQAVLIDLENNRYFAFFLEIWPQEFYYITGLLIVSALALFLFTAVAGRVWCGYACPQTVWTDLMISLERFWQGDRNERLKLDKMGWVPIKIYRRLMTHLSWMAVGLLTGGALVFYFRDAPTLARELMTGTAPYYAYMFLGIFAATTYVFGGLSREQVCTYMCPWPRIQAAMTDRHTLLVGYRTERGEPRGPHKKGDTWEGRGDCVDCNACVVVCPAGIDIRDGSQLECIQCALCIDACNDVMTKVGRPQGLIAYDTVAKQEANACGKHEPFQIVRPRTILYSGVLALVTAILLTAWHYRPLVEINALHDRNPPYVQLTDGGVRNAYTVKLLNKRHEPRDMQISVAGLPGATISVVGSDASKGAILRVPTDTVREVRLLVSLPRAEVDKIASRSASFKLLLKDIASGDESARTINFQMPER